MNEEPTAKIDDPKDTNTQKTIGITRIFFHFQMLVGFSVS